LVVVTGFTVVVLIVVTGLVVVAALVVVAGLVVVTDFVVIGLGSTTWHLSSVRSATLPTLQSRETYYTS
jgi:hypothetical protein